MAPRTKTRIVRTDPPEGYTDENHYGQFTNVEEKIPGADLDDPETFKKIAYAAMQSGIDPTRALTMMTALKDKKHKADTFRGTKAYQQAEMTLRPMVEKYGLQWDDSKYYWQNYNEARKSLDPEQKQQFDREAQASMMRGSEKPETRQSIEADILRKYRAGDQLSEREQNILDNVMKDSHFNMALKSVQENMDTRYLSPEEQLIKAEELSSKIRQSKTAQQRRQEETTEGVGTGSAFDYVIDRQSRGSGGSGRFGKRQETGGMPEGAVLVPNAKTKDGRPVYKLKDGRFATPQ